MTKPKEGRKVSRVGRDGEMRIVGSLIDGACEGSGGALVVRGAPGIGKSALLADATYWAQARAMRVLTCQGVRAESNLPFAALHQLLCPVFNALPKLSAHQARLLRGAFGAEETVPTGIYGVGLAALELLAIVASGQPLLIAADDAQWIDRPSIDVLAFLGRRISAEPIAMMVAVQEGADEHSAGHDLPQLELGPLDAQASVALLNQIAPDLPNDLRRLVLLGAAGNPLAITELPATADHWGSSPDQMPVGELLEKAFTTRTESLPKQTRALLLAAAAGSSRSLAELFAAATQLHGELIGPADLQPAIDAKLVSIADEQIVFGHPLMASAIYQSANIGERLETHTALANSVTDPDSRVWHRAAAAFGHDDVLAADLEAIAEAAARRGAVSVSIAALDRAASLGSDRTRAADVLLLASEQAVELGRRELALALLAKADHDPLSSFGEARRLVVYDEVSPGRSYGPLTVPALIQAARSALSAGDADLAASVLWTTAKRCSWTGASTDDRQALDTAVHELDAYELPATPADDSRRLVTLAYAGASQRRDDLERDLLRMSARSEGFADLANLGSAAMYLGDFALAVPLVGDAIAQARRQGRLGFIPRLQCIGAWSSIWSGTMDAVTVAAGEAHRLAVELDQPMWVGVANFEQALVDGFAGDYPGAKEQVKSGLLEWEVRGMPMFSAMATYGLGVVALGAGEYNDAYHFFRSIIEPANRISHYAARQWLAGDLAEAALRADRLNECKRLVEEIIDEGRANPTTYLRRQTLYATALLASDAKSDECFEVCIEVEPSAGDMFSGRLKLAYGIWLRRQRRVRQARVVLREARELFAHLGTVGFLHRADRELRAAGGKFTGPSAAGLPVLTPQELQIARLAARGLSNRQIAEQLFLSHRTVGSHLYNIFPKLGITTRNQLPGVMRTSQDAPSGE